MRTRGSIEQNNSLSWQISLGYAAIPAVNTVASYSKDRKAFPRTVVKIADVKILGVRIYSPDGNISQRNVPTQTVFLFD